MEKRDELRDPRSCLSKAQPEEPLFVLRANDPLFAPTVRLWAAMAVGTHEPDKIGQALREADAGMKWRDDRQPQVADDVKIDVRVLTGTMNPYSHLPHGSAVERR